MNLFNKDNKYRIVTQDKIWALHLDLETKAEFRK